MPFLPLATDPAAPENAWTTILKTLGVIGEKAMWVAIIAVSAYVVALLLRLVIRRIVRRIVDTAKSKAKVDDTQALERSPLADMRLIQRTRTLGSILQNIINVILVVVALLLIVYVLSPALLSSLTLLTAAVGAGLGFGAQNIVKDVLNGLFLVAEDQIGIGDVVDLGLASGVVEHVSVRVTQVRDVNGTLWYVRNGEVTRIGNMSQGWARAIIDIGVSPDSDLDLVEGTMLETALILAKDPKWRTRIIEKPEIWGLRTIEGDALVVRVVMKTRALAMDDVSQELRRRLRDALVEKNIPMPQLASVNLTGFEGARRVRGANPPMTRPNPVTGVPLIADRGIWRRKKSGDEEGDAK